MRPRTSSFLRPIRLWRALGACALAATLGAAGSHRAALAQQTATQSPATESPAAGQPAAPQEEPQLPRFRGGTNLVRLDAYVSANGAAVTDLTADDFEVFEDDKPQKVEGFELVRARGPGANTDTVSSPNPNSTQEQREAAQDPSARVFVVFVDNWHVSLGGSARSSEPIAAFLDKVVGPGDLVGVMTPDISAENITLTRRGTGIDRMLRDAWTFGQRDRLNTLDPHEQDIKACYPEAGSTSGIAQEMIDRLREQKTLRALDGMIRYLDGLREERKFVVLLSEGWILFRRSDQLARPLGGTPPGGAQPVGVGGDGRLTTQSDPRNGAAAGIEACERERVMLSYIDHELEVRQLAQRANRANVSFYPVDPRGLTAFDESLGAARPRSPEEDRQRLGARQDALKTLAEQTDGAWVLNTNDTAGGLTRILADTSSYYLLSYYSTNPKLDGRFRRITVNVKRPDTEVRSRPGYLAPTESEARAAGAASGGGLGGGLAGSRPAPSASVSRALDALLPGRATQAVRIQAIALADRVRAVIELDPATLKLPEWQTGGTLQLSIESERGGAPKTIEVSFQAGQRSVVVEGPEEALAPGRYTLRAEARSERSGSSVRASTDVVVAAPGATISSQDAATPSWAGDGARVRADRGSALQADRAHSPGSADPEGRPGHRHWTRADARGPAIAAAGDDHRAHRRQVRRALPGGGGHAGAAGAGRLRAGTDGGQGYRDLRVPHHPLALQLPPVVKRSAKGASGAPEVPRIPSARRRRTSRKRSHRADGRIVTLRSLPS